MILNDVHIKEVAPEIVYPYDESRVQPASYDICLGASFRVFENHEIFYIDLNNIPERMTQEVKIEGDGEVTIHPGEFILGCTHEVVKMPDDLVARIEGRSSIGRLGLQVHATAGYIDPGFHGAITLEMFNQLRIPIILRPGLVVAQLVFESMTGRSEKPYAGRYQGDMGATESRYSQ